MEADLVLLAQLPSPDLFFGTVNSNTVRVEWVTEFLDPPTPQIRTNILKRQSDPALRKTMTEPDLIDSMLNFGDLLFPLGRAFAWDGASPSDTNTPAQIRLANPARDTNDIFVAKHWTRTADGRTVLVETVDWSDLAPKVAPLPESGRVASAQNPKAGRGVRTAPRRAEDSPPYLTDLPPMRLYVSKERQLPEIQVAAKRSDKPMRVACAPYHAMGFVWDYVTVGSSGDYTFDSGVTYLASGFFNGTVTFQPGCIVKIPANDSVSVYGPVVCNGNANSYSILTSKDEDLFGERIESSTGHPTYAANYALQFYYPYTDTTASYLRIRWARTGIEYDPSVQNHALNNVWFEKCQTGAALNGNDVSTCSFTLSNCQFENSNSGFFVDGATVWLNNDTKCNVTTEYDYGGSGFVVNGGMTPATDCLDDTDEDALPDSWETQYFGTLAYNGVDDPDGDGLNNLQEYQWGANPSSSDTDGDGLADGCEVYIGHNILLVDSDGNGVSDGAEDTDADGDDDFTECIVGSDPLVPDSGPLPPLQDGLVLSGHYDIEFTPVPGYQNVLGPLLFCNNYVTADSLVTTEPSAGHLSLDWNSTFIHYGGFFASPAQPDGPGPDGPDPQLTDAERAALRDAFGEGTDMDVGRLSRPDQPKVDQLPEHVLDYYQKVASEQLRKDFQLIQEVNTGVRQPPPGIFP